MKNLRSGLNKMFNDPHSRMFVWTNDFLAAVTILSVLALILETVETLSGYRSLFITIEYAAVFFFSLEYAGRMLAARKSLEYIFSFFGLVDLLAIIPSYALLLNFTFLKTARVLRILRFLRMIRVAKLAHPEVARLKEGEHPSIYKLNISIYFFALFCAVVIFGTLLYIAEGTTTGAENIPMAMIWVSKVIMGGVAQHSPLSVWGDLIIIFARFTGLMLFGLLVYIVGHSVRWALFGSREM